MPRILVLNSNTTASVTDLVLRHTREVLGSGHVCIGATARFGARYISNEAAYAIASHAALDAYAEAGSGFDAVLLACFGDPGLFALKEVAPVPVVGLAEAALIEAGEVGPVSIVTGGALWKVMLERLALALGMRERIASIRTITWTGDRIAADPDGAVTYLAEEARAAARMDGARALVLGGAALAGMAPRIAPLVDMPVIDSVHAGARVAARLAEAYLAAPAKPAARAPTPTVGIGPSLARLIG
ncbi:MAG: aspartate/glutamate racemase family protein [Burkholderiales bacterium]